MARINIKGINKAEILRRLYNNSQIQGMGIFQAKSGEMTTEQAEKELEKTMDFDYLHGKVMKINLAGDEIETFLYDRDNGTDAAENALLDLLVDRMEV